MQQDPQQRLVATRDVSVRQLVLAGPGTGKTETVALRLSHLLETGVGPAQILVLSFSRSAVRTVAERLERFAGNAGGVLEDLRHISIRTFDSWTFRLLRQLGDVPKDLFKLSYDGLIDRLTGLILGARRADIHDRLAGVRHVIIDEFQDLSGVRGRFVLALLDLLAPPLDERVGFTILGDEAQAIYGFALQNQSERGLPGLTTAELLEAIRSRYGSALAETQLDTNHRAVAGLAHVALMLRKILRRPTSNANKLDALRDMLQALPESVQLLNPDLIQGLNGQPTAILTRTNGEAIRVWQRIMGTECQGPSWGVMLHGSGTNSTVPAWVGATLGQVQGNSISRQRFGKVYQYLYGGEEAPLAAALAIPDEETAWHRLLRGAQQPYICTALDLGELRSRLGWPDLFPDDQGAQACPLNIMTVHQSKGREFAHVLLLESRRKVRIPKTEEKIREEASVIFVAFSRAGEKLRRISAVDLKPLTSWDFPRRGRKRWGWRINHSHSEAEFQLEIGISGDVEATSFIDTRLHESESAVAEVQALLVRNPTALIGRKVILCRIPAPELTKDRFIYEIHLDESGEPGQRLGAMSKNLTVDLLAKLNRQFSLPVKIRNLRITDVVTLGLQGEDTTALATPWSTSGFWLGVNIFGVGEFVPRRKGM